MINNIVSYLLGPIILLTSLLLTGVVACWIAARRAPSRRMKIVSLHVSILIVLISCGLSVGLTSVLNQKIGSLILRTRERLFQCGVAIELFESRYGHYPLSQEMLSKTAKISGGGNQSQELGTVPVPWILSSKEGRIHVSIGAHKSTTIDGDNAHWQDPFARGQTGQNTFRFLMWEDWLKTDEEGVELNWILCSRGPSRRWSFDFSDLQGQSTEHFTIAIRQFIYDPTNGLLSEGCIIAGGRNGRTIFLH